MNGSDGTHTAPLPCETLETQVTCATQRENSGVGSKGKKPNIFFRPTPSWLSPGRYTRSTAAKKDAL